MVTTLRAMRCLGGLLGSGTITLIVSGCYTGQARSWQRTKTCARKHASRGQSFLYDPQATLLKGHTPLLDIVVCVRFHDSTCSARQRLRAQALCRRGTVTPEKVTPVANQHCHARRWKKEESKWSAPSIRNGKRMQIESVSRKHNGPPISPSASRPAEHIFS